MVNGYLNEHYVSALEARVQETLHQCRQRIWGFVTAVSGETIHISGLGNIAHVGDQISFTNREKPGPHGEIIALEGGEGIALLYEDPGDISIGTEVQHTPARPMKPSASWIGSMLNHAGLKPDGTRPAEGVTASALKAAPPPPSRRKPLGERLSTGYAAFDTFLPLCKGQRLGLFAGSGVGKSTLVAGLAKGVEADVVILALIGERGRELRNFVDNTLGPEGMKRAIVVSATSNEPAPLKKRAAYTAMALAEFFRDQGLHVLLLFDSLTRFAEAHREVALTAGEIPSLRAFPPSTFRAVASLTERAGPGAEGQGDITAVFSVLVAGSDMDEPVADMVRGILDGHVILDREIAERGRYPAIDIRRSVSRSLPEAASSAENAMLARARAILADHEDAAPMIRAGLYVAGSDPSIDEAIRLWPALDRFVGSVAEGNSHRSFLQLHSIIDGVDIEEANGDSATDKPVLAAESLDIGEDQVGAANTANSAAL